MSLKIASPTVKEFAPQNILPVVIIDPLPVLPTFNVYPLLNDISIETLPYPRSTPHCSIGTPDISDTANIFDPVKLSVTENNWPCVPCMSNLALGVDVPIPTLAVEPLWPSWSKVIVSISSPSFFTIFNVALDTLPVCLPAEIINPLSLPELINTETPLLSPASLFVVNLAAKGNSPKTAVAVLTWSFGTPLFVSSAELLVALIPTLPSVAIIILPPVVANRKTPVPVTSRAIVELVWE